MVHPDRSVHLRRAAPKLYQKPSTWMRDQIEGEEGLAKGAEAGAEAAADGVDVFSDEQAWDVLAYIPNDSAAALVLIEHHWAVPLRDAIARAGGFRLSDGLISPLDLVEIGLMEADEAKDLHAMEKTAAATKQ